jgi:phosphoglycolate phosphatase
MRTQQSDFPRLFSFDLDGTLVDSAPDFIAVINRMRADRGRVQWRSRPASGGVEGRARQCWRGFPDVDSGEREAWVQEFLDLYERELGLHGKPFEASKRCWPRSKRTVHAWGIVTNKPEYLAQEAHAAAVLGVTLPRC